MVRKRSTPWIHRWSRPLIGAIATIGAIITSYLTYTKLTGGAVVCSVNEAAKAATSCNDVLSSPWATVFGLPLSLFGLLAYLSMITFALSPLAINPEEKRELRTNLENWTWLMLLVGATAMTVFSSYLMYVLAFKLQAVCLYCITSACFALSFLVLTIIGRNWEDLGQIFYTGVIVAVVTFVGTLGVYANVNNPNLAAGDRVPIPTITTSPQPGKGWPIETESGQAEIELAKYLTTKGIKMYGAYWCPHCHEQKLLFGAEAFKELNYVECANDGQNAQPQKCDEAGISSYPAWQINGEIVSGVQELKKLAELTGYQGPINFKYKMPY